MPKKVIDEKCPHCGGTQGFYKKTLYRVQQDFTFDAPLIPQSAWYSEVSGGVQMRCLDCNRQIEIDV